MDPPAFERAPTFSRSANTADDGPPSFSMLMSRAPTFGRACDASFECTGTAADDGPPSFGRTTANDNMLMRSAFAFPSSNVITTGGGLPSDIASYLPSRGTSFTSAAGGGGMGIGCPPGGGSGGFGGPPPSDFVHTAASWAPQGGTLARTGSSFNARRPSWTGGTEPASGTMPYSGAPAVGGRRLPQPPPLFTAFDSVPAAPSLASPTSGSASLPYPPPPITSGVHACMQSGLASPPTGRISGNSSAALELGQCRTASTELVLEPFASGGTVYGHVLRLDVPSSPPLTRVPAAAGVHMTAAQHPSWTSTLQPASSAPGMPYGGAFAGLAVQGSGGFSPVSARSPRYHARRSEDGGLAGSWASGTPIGARSPNYGAPLSEENMAGGEFHGGFGADARSPKYARLSEDGGASASLSAAASASAAVAEQLLQHGISPRASPLVSPRMSPRASPRMSPRASPRMSPRASEAGGCSDGAGYGAGPSGAAAAGPDAAGPDAADGAGCGKRKRNWQAYNEFDRDHYKQHGVRPNYAQAKDWYAKNKHLLAIDGSEPPTLKELVVHRGRFRVDTDRTRQYTQQRRARKRAADGQEPVLQRAKSEPIVVDLPGFEDLLGADAVANFPIPHTPTLMHAGPFANLFADNGNGPDELLDWIGPELADGVLGGGGGVDVMGGGGAMAAGGGGRGGMAAAQGLRGGLPQPGDAMLPLFEGAPSHGLSTTFSALYGELFGAGSIGGAAASASGPAAAGMAPRTARSDSSTDNSSKDTTAGGSDDADGEGEVTRSNSGHDAHGLEVRRRWRLLPPVARFLWLKGAVRDAADKMRTRLNF